MAKKNEHWWNVYRAIFKTLHGREPERTEFSPRSAEATNAAFDALGLPTYERPAAKFLPTGPNSTCI